MNKLRQGPAAHVLDRIVNGDVALVVNTTDGRQAVSDSYYIRSESLTRKIPYTTTLGGALAICAALAYRVDGPVYRLSDVHEDEAFPPDLPTTPLQTLTDDPTDDNGDRAFDHDPSAPDQERRDEAARRAGRSSSTCSAPR